MNDNWLQHIDRVMPLNGHTVRLEALSMTHHGGLCTVGLDDDIWRWGLSLLRTREDMAVYIETALKLRAAGVAFPFAIIDRKSGRIAGSTRFANIDVANRRLEIGWTWLGREFQRSPINTETKYHLLRIAFEQLRCIRVEFKTDVLNQASRTALARIGAKQEGIFRRHMVTSTGRVRDSVYFSIIDAEWPHVKQALELKMARTLSA